MHIIIHSEAKTKTKVASQTNLGTDMRATILQVTRLNHQSTDSYRIPRGIGEVAVG